MSDGSSIDRKRLRTSTSAKRPLLRSLSSAYLQLGVGDGAADRESGEREHVGVRRRVIAVHPHFAKPLGRLRKAATRHVMATHANRTAHAPHLSHRTAPHRTCAPAHLRTCFQGLILVVTSASR